MTAVGKITAASLQVGDIVLFQLAYAGADHWMPAYRKEKGTFPARVTEVSPVTARPSYPGRQRSRVLVTCEWLTMAPDTVSFNVSPSQTFWLASASRKWAEYMERKGTEVKR